MVERREETAVLAAGRATAEHSYVDWPAILVGAFVATAASFVLHTFGAALGLSVVSPYGAEDVGLGLLIGAALWVMWVSISCFMLGAYIAGRMRRRAFDATEHEVDVRDGAHGIAVWAVGIVFSAFIAAAGVNTAVRAGAEAVSAGIEAGAEAGATAVDRVSEQPAFRNALNRLFRPDAEAGAGAFGNAVDTERRAALGEEFTAILEGAGEAGEVDAGDRSYMASALAAETGLTQEQAAARVEQAVSEWRELQRQAAEAVDAARKAAIVAAFVLAASLLIAGAGAWWAAGMGGDHRDRQTVVALLRRRR